PRLVGGTGLALPGLTVELEGPAVAGGGGRRGRSGARPSGGGPAARPRRETGPGAPKKVSRVPERTTSLGGAVVRSRTAGLLRGRMDGRVGLRVDRTVACRISELVLGCRDPEALARFWCEVLDFVILDREDDGTLEIGPREGFGGAQPTIILSRRDEPEKGKSLLHIDVTPT